MSEYKLRKMSHEITITVTFVETREWKLRKWIAKQLIVLASKVLGCGIEVVDNAR